MIRIGIIVYSATLSRPLNELGLGVLTGTGI